jgi:PAS domain S-box-containing protein
VTAPALSPLPAALKNIPSDISRDALREMRVRYVQQQASLGALVNLALATLIMILWWPYGDHVTLLVWYGALALLGLLRVGQRHQFFAAAAPNTLADFERRFCALVWLTGAVWGLGALLLMQGVPFEHQFLVILVLAGLCAGGIVHLSPVLDSYRRYVPLMLTPISLWCALHDSAVYRSLAMMSVVFAIALLSAGRHYSRHFNRATELAAALQQTEARFASAFHNAPIGMLLVDADGLVVHANRVTEEIYGADPDYCLRRPFWAMAIAADSTRLAGRFTAMRLGQVSEFCLETQQTSSQGLPLWVRVSGSSTV